MKYLPLCCVELVKKIRYHLTAGFEEFLLGASAT